MKKYMILDIAYWFLCKAPMTHSKLQKLCYYTQAWHHTLYDTALFNGEFRAWHSGPIAMSLYSPLEFFGRNTLNKHTIMNTKPIDDETQTFLERIWNNYGKFSDNELEQLIKSEMPYIEARDNFQASLPEMPIINILTIKSYYSKQTLN